jgi:hypothetical protein
MLFSDNLVVVLELLILQDKHDIPTLSIKENAFTLLAKSSPKNSLPCILCEVRAYIITIFYRRSA